MAALGDRAEGERGEDSSRHLPWQLCSPRTGSKMTDISTGSWPFHQSVNVPSGSSTQFFFLILSAVTRCISHQSKKEIPEMGFNSILQISIEHLRCSHCFCIWASRQMRDEKQRSRADHPFPLGGEIQVPDNSFQRRMALVTPSLDRFHKAVSLASYSLGHP